MYELYEYDEEAPAISICTTIYNKCFIDKPNGKRQPFIDLLASVARSDLTEVFGKGGIEWTVADYGSTDANLQDVMDVMFPHPSCIIDLTHEAYNCGGKDSASFVSSFEYLLFLDPDVVVPENFFSICLNQCDNGFPFVPACTRATDVAAEGWSNMMIMNEDFLDTKGWGAHDDEVIGNQLIASIRNKGMCVRKKPVQGFHYQRM